MSNYLSETLKFWKVSKIEGTNLQYGNIIYMLNITSWFISWFGSQTDMVIVHYRKYLTMEAFVAERGKWISQGHV